jgi:hypothetical protein
MGSSSISYPTCPSYSNGDVTVARYPAIEINSGNVSYFAFSRSDLPLIAVLYLVYRRTGTYYCRIREGMSGSLFKIIRVRESEDCISKLSTWTDLKCSPSFSCIAYFFRQDLYQCYPKVRLLQPETQYYRRLTIMLSCRQGGYIQPGSCLTRRALGPSEPLRGY